MSVARIPLVLDPPGRVDCQYQHFGGFPRRTLFFGPAPIAISSTLQALPQPSEALQESGLCQPVAIQSTALLGRWVLRAQQIEADTDTIHYQASLEFRTSNR